MSKLYVLKQKPFSAIQWTGDNLEEIKSFCTDENGTEMFFMNGKDLWIKRNEGEIMVNIRDYIKKDDVELSSFTESIFKKIHDELSDVFNYGKISDKEAEFHEFSHKKIPAKESGEALNEVNNQKHPLKSLHNTDSNGAKKNVRDIQFWGNGDTFKLISKASSKLEGWMKSTKSMEIEGVGCVVQTTTQQRNPDGSYALTDALVFVPNTTIKEEFISNDENPEGVINGRKLIKTN